MLPFITLDGVALHDPEGRRLFDNLTLAVGAGRIGLVGRNGSGKTSLLRLIAGELAPSAGSQCVRGRVAMLRQDQRLPASARLADLLGVAEGLDRLERIHAGRPRPDDLAAADWVLPVNIEAALAEVGLQGFDPERPAAELSGGEATRAALAGILMAAPDVILLDEPTNNLDRDARGQVADILARWTGGAVIASHDRGLLRGMEKIVELSTLGARVYSGGWEFYAERRAAEALAAEDDLNRAGRELRRTEREIQLARERKARADAAGHRRGLRGGQPRIVLGAMAERAQNTGGREDRLADRRRADAEVDFAAARARVEWMRPVGLSMPPSGLPVAKMVLAFEHVGFGYPGEPPLLAGVNLRLVGPARLAVRGPNGSGKTTIIRLASGALEPTAGRIVRGAQAMVLDQRAELLDDSSSLLDNFRRLHPAASLNDAHAALARFLFRNRQADRPAGELSGGERLRAALACILVTPAPPRLIILDEPTNHLDLESVAAIEEALVAYDGAILAVSHDNDFLTAIGAEESLDLRHNENPLRPEPKGA